MALRIDDFTVRLRVVGRGGDCEDMSVGCFARICPVGCFARICPVGCFARICPVGCFTNEAAAILTTCIITV